MSDVVLKAAPAVTPRKETVPVPEWGGSVIVRGLLASEAFAVVSHRQAAFRRIRTEAAEAGKSADQAPELTFDELKQYGSYVPLLLSLAVVNGEGMALYSAADWELVAQSHPGVFNRLQPIAERLSGLVAEDVAKNSPQSPS